MAMLIVMVKPFFVAKHTKGHEINRVEILNGAGGWEDHMLLSFKVELRTEQSERD